MILKDLLDVNLYPKNNLTAHENNRAIYYFHVLLKDLLLKIIKDGDELKNLSE